MAVPLASNQPQFQIAFIDEDGGGPGGAATKVAPEEGLGRRGKYWLGIALTANYKTNPI